MRPPADRRGGPARRAIGTWLARAELTPDRVSSPRRGGRPRPGSTRARSSLSGPQPIHGPADLRQHRRAGAGDHPRGARRRRTVAVVGHNPSIRELAAALDDGRGNPEARRALDRGFPAGGVAVFVLPGSFAAIAPGAATLTEFTVPGD